MLSSPSSALLSKIILWADEPSDIQRTQAQAFQEMHPAIKEPDFLNTFISGILKPHLKKLTQGTPQEPDESAVLSLLDLYLSFRQSHLFLTCFWQNGIDQGLEHAFILHTITKAKQWLDVCFTAIVTPGALTARKECQGFIEDYKNVCALLQAIYPLHIENLSRHTHQHSDDLRLKNIFLLFDASKKAYEIEVKALGHDGEAQKQQLALWSEEVKANTSLLRYAKPALKNKRYREFIDRCTQFSPATDQNLALVPMRRALDLIRFHTAQEFQLLPHPLDPKKKVLWPKSDARPVTKEEATRLNESLEAKMALKEPVDSQQVTKSSQISYPQTGLLQIDLSTLLTGFPCLIAHPELFSKQSYLYVLRGIDAFKKKHLLSHTALCELLLDELSLYEETIKSLYLNKIKPYQLQERDSAQAAQHKRKDGDLPIIEVTGSPQQIEIAKEIINGALIADPALRKKKCTKLAKRYTAELGDPKLCQTLFSLFVGFSKEHLATWSKDQVDIHKIKNLNELIKVNTYICLWLFQDRPESCLVQGQFNLVFATLLLDTVSLHDALERCGKKHADMLPIKEAYGGKLEACHLLYERHIQALTKSTSDSITRQTAQEYSLLSAGSALIKSYQVMANSKELPFKEQELYLSLAKGLLAFIRENQPVYLQDKSLDTATFNATCQAMEQSLRSLGVNLSLKQSESGVEDQMMQAFSRFFEEQPDKRDEEIATLKGQLRQKQVALTDLAKEKKGLEKRLSAAQSASAQLNTQIQRLKAEVAQRKEHIAAKDVKLAAQRKELGSKNKAISAQKQTETLKEKQIKELTTQRDEIVEQIRLLNQTHQKTITQYKELELAHKKDLAYIEELRSNLSDLTLRLTEQKEVFQRDFDCHQKAMAANQQELERLRTASERDHGDIDNLAGQLAALTLEVEQTQSTSSTQKATIALLNDAKARSDESYLAVKQENSALQAQLQQSRMALEHSTRRLIEDPAVSTLRVLPEKALRDKKIIKATIDAQEQCFKSDQTVLQSLTVDGFDFQKIRQLIQALEQGPHDRAFIDGGFLRCILTKTRPNDVDIVTTCSLQWLKRNPTIAGFYFQQNPFIPHLFRDETHRVDIVCHPNLDLKEEGQLRDLTCNSLFLNASLEILDLTGQGLKDIAEKKLVVIGKPSERFKEDPSRILRLVRFSCELAWHIDASYVRLMQVVSSKMHTIPFGVFHKNMRVLLELPNSIDALRYLNLLSSMFSLSLSPICSQSDLIYPFWKYRQQLALSDQGSRIDPIALFLVFTYLNEREVYSAQEVAAHFLDAWPDKNMNNDPAYRSKVTMSLTSNIEQYVRDYTDYCESIREYQRQTQAQARSSSPQVEKTYTPLLSARNSPQTPQRQVHPEPLEDSKALEASTLDFK